MSNIMTGGKLAIKFPDAEGRFARAKPEDFHESSRGEATYGNLATI